MRKGSKNRVSEMNIFIDKRIYLQEENSERAYFMQALFMISILAVISFVLSFFVFSFPVLALEGNSTEAERILEHCSSIVEEMREEGFPVMRVNDTLTYARQIFEAQKMNEALNRSADYSVVFSSCEEIEKVREAAYQARDMRYVVENEYADLEEKAQRYGADISGIRTLMGNMIQEFQNERYEKAIEAGEETESKVIEADAAFTTFHLYYETVTRGVKDFFKENWKFLLITFAVSVVILVIFWRRISKYLLKRKLRRLEVEKKVLLQMVKRDQREYFERGGISEATYSLRAKKFGEMIRDIDRQIPLVQEQLVNLKVRRRTGAGGRRGKRGGKRR